MIISEVNLKIWYDEYQKQFNKTAKYITQRGGSVNASPMSYRAFSRDFRMMASASDAKTGGQAISRKLAKMQLESRSYKQSKAAALSYSNQSGKAFTTSLVTEFRYGTGSSLSFDAQVAARNTELREQGVRGSARRLILSQEFFGSE